MRLSLAELVVVSSSSVVAPEWAAVPSCRLTAEAVAAPEAVVEKMND